MMPIKNYLSASNVGKFLGFLAVLFIQVFLGVNNVLSSLPLWNAVAHNIVGVMLFLSFVIMTFLGFRRTNGNV